MHYAGLSAVSTEQALSPPVFGPGLARTPWPTYALTIGPWREQTTHQHQNDRPCVTGWSPAAQLHHARRTFTVAILVSIIVVGHAPRRLGCPNGQSTHSSQSRMLAWQHLRHSWEYHYLLAHCNQVGWPHVAHAHRSYLETWCPSGGFKGSSCEDAQWHTPVKLRLAVPV